MKVKVTVTHSLRGRLLWFLLAAIIMAALAQASIAYRSALYDADQIFDYHMQQMALSLRSGAPLANHAEALPADPANNDMVVQVWTPDGVQVFRSITRAELPQRAVLGFSNVKANGTTYRIFSVQTSSQTVQIAQDMAVRKRMAGSLALRTVGPIALMAPILMLVVWWVVSGSLAPVSRVRKPVAARQADDLSPVSESGLPDEVRPLVHELNLLFDRVKTAFDAQQHFVADAAHELRTPLAALKLQVLSLERAESEDKRSLAISRVSAGIERATRLVEQLLVLARQEASAASGDQLQLVDLNDVVKRALGDMAGVAQARKIDLGLHHMDPASAAGQADALNILLRNLVDNAIKYTPQGQAVRISLRSGVSASAAAAVGDPRAARFSLLTPDRASDLYAALRVSDAGVGLAREHLPRLTERFYRVEGQKSGERSGTGLGLAIVKHIVNRHRGGLTVESMPGDGSMFSVYLPMIDAGT